ncbi:MULTISPECIES: GNAT family N-acetyltransferase [Catenuloplanes]|uniref:Ribosomal protein S18 acetylase RimI-like enzyme n=1 Tax=Catenuloplanes niger TaxID=587534 RepID=A0AAE3ZW18_9ACTN|nr:GNAT family N-acetyltransferase [Catenuloplanes niger]MDR7327048.1 ribosomal protein S18 acetylase RimI-like enzyme [Catenuloplanes niger]
MRTVHGLEALAVVDDLIALYADVFTGPPWNEGPEDVADFRRRLHEDAARPGFRAVLTADGFATGWPTELPLPDVQAYQEIVDHLGPERVVELLDGVFEVNELAVRASARRRGVGRRLLDEVVGDAPRAWLVTSRDAPDAVAFYRRAGWREIAPAPAYHGDLIVFRTAATQPA